MRMPEFPLSHNFPDTLKGWEAKEKNRAEWYAYWEWMRNRRFHALPEEKGTPVPGTGVRRSRRSWTHNGQSVSAGSHVLSHYYASEGDKGRWVRKVVRNRERALWISEWQEEQSYSEYDAETVAQWFYDGTDDIDSDLIPSVYTVGETVVEWPSDPWEDDYYYEDAYDRYGDSEEYDGFCFHCGGPCEL